MYAFFSSLCVRITTSDRIALHRVHHVPMLLRRSHSSGVKIIWHRDDDEIRGKEERAQRERAHACVPLDIQCCTPSQGFARSQPWPLA